MPCVPGRLLLPLISGLKFSTHGPLGDGTNVTEPPWLSASEPRVGAPEPHAARATAARSSRDKSAAAPRDRVRIEGPFLRGFGDACSSQIAGQMCGEWRPGGRLRG